VALVPGGSIWAGGQWPPSSTTEAPPTKPPIESTTESTTSSVESPTDDVRRLSPEETLAELDRMLGVQTAEITSTGGMPPPSYAPTQQVPVAPPAPAAATAQMPAAAPPPGAHDLPASQSAQAMLAAAETRSRLPLYLGALLALVAGVLVMVLPTVSSRIDFDDARVADTQRLADLAGNAPIVVVVALVLLVVGTVLSGTGRRLGAGLAGGAAAGLAALSATLMAKAVDVFDTTARTMPNDRSYTLTRTYEAGFFVLAALVGLGFLTFLLSMWAAGRDGRRTFHPIIAIVGCLMVLACAAGPLIPVNEGTWRANLGNAVVSDRLAAVRLIALGIVAFTGVVAFAQRRRWGAGAAIGISAVGVTLMLTDVLGASVQSRDNTVPFGLGNYFAEGAGTTVTGYVHPVTAGSLCAALLLGVVAWLATPRAVDS
jgi:hypothetical protein